MIGAVDRGTYRASPRLSTPSAWARGWAARRSFRAVPLLPERGTPTMSQSLTSRSTVRRASLALALLAALAGRPSMATAQDPVGELKKELLYRPYVGDFLLTPEKRKEELKKAYEE